MIIDNFNCKFFYLVERYLLSLCKVQIIFSFYSTKNEKQLFSDLIFLKFNNRYYLKYVNALLCCFVFVMDKLNK